MNMLLMTGRRRWLPGLFTVLLGWLAAQGACLADTTISLDQLKRRALQNHPALQTAQAQLEGAQAGEQTASSYPNPELELFQGPTQARARGANSGMNWGIGFAQPFDAPALRARRQELAAAGTAQATTSLRQARIALLNQVEAAYLEILRHQSALQISHEDIEVLQQARDRVRVRVESGEAPKFDLIKAEAELLNAERMYQTTLLRLQQAKVKLQSLVGADQMEEFELNGEPPAPPALPDRETLWADIAANNPDLALATGATSQAQARLRLEQQLRQPQLTIKGAMEQDPDMRNWRLGVALPLPLWNQRQGPIREATAAIIEATARLNHKQLAVRQEMDTAYSRYEIAQRQVEYYEGGLLKQAHAALKVAEAAYRYGERGILDYLDAERTYRMVRIDFINARYESQSALVELARLRAQELFGDTQ